MHDSTPSPPDRRLRNYPHTHKVWLAPLKSNCRANTRQRWSGWLATASILCSLVAASARAEIQYSVLSSVYNEATGDSPQYRLLQGPVGVFYGVARYGGILDLAHYGSYGTVFKLTTTGQRSPVYQFSGLDGAYPTSLMLGSNGDFYGTADFGGRTARARSFGLLQTGCS